MTPEFAPFKMSSGWYFYADHALRGPYTSMATAYPAERRLPGVHGHFSGLPLCGGGESMTKIRFLKVWGHPTRNEIYGPGDICVVTDWAAAILTNGGTAELITAPTEPEAPGASA